MATRPRIENRDSLELESIGAVLTCLVSFSHAREAAGRCILSGAIITVMKNSKARLLPLCAVGTVVIALALFLSAGTVRYWQAWAYLAVNAVACIYVTAALLVGVASREAQAQDVEEALHRCKNQGQPTIDQWDD
jgi:hypothetical protein